MTKEGGGGEEGGRVKEGGGERREGERTWRCCYCKGSR